MSAIATAPKEMTRLLTKKRVKGEHEVGDREHVGRNAACLYSRLPVARSIVVHVRLLRSGSPSLSPPENPNQQSGRNEHRGPDDDRVGEAYREIGVQDGLL